MPWFNTSCLPVRPSLLRVKNVNVGHWLRLSTKFSQFRQVHRRQWPVPCYVIMIGLDRTRGPHIYQKAKPVGLVFLHTSRNLVQHWSILYWTYWYCTGKRIWYIKGIINFALLIASNCFNVDIRSDLHKPITSKLGIMTVRTDSRLNDLDILSRLKGKRRRLRQSSRKRHWFIWGWIWLATGRFGLVNIILIQSCPFDLLMQHVKAHAQFVSFG